MKQPALLAAWRGGVVVVGEFGAAAIAALEPFVAVCVALPVDYAVDELEEVSASTSAVPLGFHSWPSDAVELAVVLPVDRLVVGLPSCPGVSATSSVFAVGVADLLPAVALQIEDSPLACVLASRSSISKPTKRTEMTKWLDDLTCRHTEKLTHLLHMWILWNHLLSRVEVSLSMRTGAAGHPRLYHAWHHTGNGCSRHDSTLHLLR